HRASVRQWRPAAGAAPARHDDRPRRPQRDALRRRLPRARRRRRQRARDRHGAGGRHLRQPGGLLMLAQAQPPVIPDFGKGSSCVRENSGFCWSWVQDNWSTVLWPALRQHIVLTVIAVVIGFAIAFTLALVAHRRRWL